MTDGQPLKERRAEKAELFQKGRDRTGKEKICCVKKSGTASA